jgi:hypothetical protein
MASAEWRSAGLGNLEPVVFLLVWLYGTLVLAERRSGYVIVLIASILASGLPIVHMAGSGLAGHRPALAAYARVTLNGPSTPDGAIVQTLVACPRCECDAR